MRRRLRARSVMTDENFVCTSDLLAIQVRVTHVSSGCVALCSSGRSQGDNIRQVIFFFCFRFCATRDECLVT